MYFNRTDLLPTLCTAVESESVVNELIMISQVDSHRTLAEGVVVQVSGELSNNGKYYQKYGRVPKSSIFLFFRRTYLFMGKLLNVTSLILTVRMSAARSGRAKNVHLR